MAQSHWQAWHNRTSTFVSHGRRGVQSHIHLRFAWQAWHSWYSVARLDLVWSPVTPVTPQHFAKQAWHNLTSTFILHSRRGTISHPPSFRVAGVALMALSGALGLGLVARDARDATAVCVAAHIHLRFAWQAWHNLTGRRGTTAHPPSFHMAGVVYNLTSTFVSRGRRGTHGTQWRAWTLFGRP